MKQPEDDINENLFKAQEHISNAIEHLKELEKLREKPKAVPFPTNNIPRNKLNVAICVGHSREGDTGATSCGGISEWTYNKKVAEYLKSDLQEFGISSFVVDKYGGTYGSYTSAINWLTKHLRTQEASVAIELHFNASDNPKAEGMEMLYWHTSRIGLSLAEYLLRGCQKYFPHIKNRGVKSRNTGDRGATFLRKTSCPAIITEPFFGSCWEPDWTTFANNEHILSQALAIGIKEWADEHIIN
jgi:N-acetylmuramoyl-L-alanine amidase